MPAYGYFILVESPPGESRVRILVGIDRFCAAIVGARAQVGGKCELKSITG